MSGLPPLSSHMSTNKGAGHTERQQGLSGRVINIVRPSPRPNVTASATNGGSQVIDPTPARSNTPPPSRTAIARDSVTTMYKAAQPGDAPVAPASKTELWESLQPIIDGENVWFGFDKNVTEKYELAEEIGAGGFGRVVIARGREDGVEYACKIIPKIFKSKDPKEVLGADRQAKHVAAIRNEVTALMRLRGTLNVVYLEGVFEDEANVYLVTEYCKGGELWHRIGDKHYSERTVASFMRAVLRTLAQCHSHNIIHRDVKPGNFMLLDKGDTAPLKAIDFGLAVAFKDEDLPLETLGFDGTPWFMAPEMLRSEVTPASDTWAAGVMAHQLLTGKFPFDDRRNPSNPALSLVWRAILLEDVDMTRSYWAGISDEAKDFIKMLLDKDPKKRPSARDALRHPWLQGDASDRTGGKPISRQVVQRIQRYAQGSVFRRTVLQSVAEELLASRLGGDTVHSTGIGAAPAAAAAAAALAIPGAVASSGGSDPSPGGSFHGPLLFGTPLKRLLDRFEFNGTEHARTPDELGAKLKEMGYKLEPSEVERLAEMLDLNDSGAVDRAAFAASIVDWKELQKNHRDEWLGMLRRAFDDLDRDRDGTVWVDDLIASLQHKLPPAEVREAVEEALGPADPGDLGQHQMSFDRFVELVTVKSCDSLESLDIYDDRWGKSRNGTQHGSTHGGSTTAAFDALRALQIAADGSQHGKGYARAAKLEPVREIS